MGVDTLLIGNGYGFSRFSITMGFNVQYTIYITVQ